MSTFKIDYKDISIIDSLPVWDHEKTILNIGCGPGDLDCYLAHLGYRVFATDMYRQKEWDDSDKKEWIDKGLLSFHDKVNIFDLKTVPIQKSPIVICSEVIEHFVDYKTVFTNLFNLADIRLIMTFPHEFSYGAGAKPGMDEWESHKTFFSDKGNSSFKDVNEFVSLASPYPVSITKNVAKDQDWINKQRDYLLVVNKRHKP